MQDAVPAGVGNHIGDKIDKGTENTGRTGSGGTGRTRAEGPDGSPWGSDDGRTGYGSPIPGVAAVSPVVPEAEIVVGGYPKIRFFTVGE